MSGIAGQICWDGTKAERGLLEKMTRLLAHRGRDGLDVWTQDNLGLAWNAMSRSNPPVPAAIFPRNDDVGVLLDGSLLQDEGLRSELSAKGYAFQTGEDAELVRHAYREYGMAMLDRLDGLFALVIVDLPKKRIFLARDRMGIKPLYYHQGPRAFSFASEIKVLVKSGAAPAALDPLGLKEYLHMQVYLDDRSLFKDIKAVPAGSYIALDAVSGKLEICPYWALPQTDISIGYEEAVTALRDIIRNAVGRWSRTEGPLGAYVSGGLDSSLVAAFARPDGVDGPHDRLLTYSSVYPDMKCADERLYSDAVAAHIQSDHHRVRLDHDELMADHADLIYMLDTPCAGFSGPYRTLARIVRREVKTVLAGHGGDEFLCGYVKNLVACALLHLNAGKKGEHRPFDLSLLRYLEGFEPLARSIFGQGLFAGEADLLKSLFFRSTAQWEAVAPAIRTEAAEYDLVGRLVQKMRSAGPDPLKQLMYLDKTLVLPGLLLVEDRTHMAENLEARTPLLAREVMEFTAALPGEYFLRDGLKGMMRRAGQGVLPELVTEKPTKSGTMFPIQELFFGPMYPEVRAKIALLDQTSIFAVPAADLLAQAQGNGRDVWALWSLACWAESYL